jgi:glycosyltransferase 2 family protein
MDVKKTLLFVLKILISAALLISLWFLIDVQVLIENFRTVRLGVLVCVLLLVPISMAARVWRFYCIINHKRKLISFADSFRLALVGETLNIILPAQSGDIAKAYYGYKQHNIKEDMITATVLDKIAGVLGLLLLGTVAAALHGYGLLAAFFGAGSAVLLAFMFIPSIIPWQWGNWLLRRRKQTLDIDKLRASFSMSTRVKFIAVAITIVAWAISYLHLYLIAQMFSLDISVLFLLSMAPLIILSRLFPFAWAGLGVQEGVTVYLFGLVGIGATYAVVVSLVFTVMSTILPGLAGLYYILTFRQKER